MLARCPNCRATFSTKRTGRQECPACGKPLLVPEAPPPAGTSPSSPAPAPGPGASPGAGAVPPPGSAGGGAGRPLPEGDDAPGTPWEQRPALATSAAWLKTMELALFDPGKLFSRARLDQGRAQLWFAVGTATVFGIAGQLIERFLLGARREELVKWMTALQGGRSLPPWAVKLMESGNDNSPSATLLAALLMPLFAFLLLYANAGVTHLAALLLGQNKRGFKATFAAAAYGTAPVVLAVIPGCGQFVALIWIAVLTGVGLKHTHGMSTGGAVGAALAPYLVLCCLSCGLTMAMVSLLGPALGFGS